MKKMIASNFVTMLTIVTFVFASCSHEEKTETTFSKGSLSEIEVMQKRFTEIMETDEYISLETNIKTFAQALKNNRDVPLDTRLNFKNWIMNESNLSKTDFVSTEHALSFYDNFIILSNTYSNKYGVFYNDLEKFEASEVLLILDPQLQTTPITTLSSPCQEFCMDRCEENIDALNNGYASNPNAWTPRGRLNYWRSYTFIVSDFNDCISSC